MYYFVVRHDYGVRSRWVQHLGRMSHERIPDIPFCSDQGEELAVHDTDGVMNSRISRGFGAAKLLQIVGHCGQFRHKGADQQHFSFVVCSPGTYELRHVIYHLQTKMLLLLHQVGVHEDSTNPTNLPEVCFISSGTCISILVSSSIKGAPHCEEAACIEPVSASQLTSAAAATRQQWGPVIVNATLLSVQICLHGDFVQSIFLESVWNKERTDESCNKVSLEESQLKVRIEVAGRYLQNRHAHSHTCYRHQVGLHPLFPCSQATPLVDVSLPRLHNRARVSQPRSQAEATALTSRHVFSRSAPTQPVKPITKVTAPRKQKFRDPTKSSNCSNTSVEFPTMAVHSWNFAKE
ncbi:Protein of unknown function [Gryllus bimaculatus]|nr:Protein of unknown function [Gryllus bimaculatus]